MTTVITREERLALLAAASGDDLIDAADACLAAASSSFAVVTPPAVGCVPAQVREPILRQRFFLGDVLACTAEVEFNGVRGWAMRLGDDRAAAIAMAVLDAAASCSPGLAREIDALCTRAVASGTADEILGELEAVA